MGRIPIHIPGNISGKIVAHTQVTPSKHVVTHVARTAHPLRTCAEDLYVSLSSRPADMCRRAI